MTNQTTSAENEGISLTVGDSLYEDSDEEESHEDELNDGDNDSTDFDEDGNTAGAAIVGVPGRESEENADWLELFDEGIQDLQSRIDHLQHQDMGLVSRRSGLDPQTSGLIGHMAELVDAESRSNSPPPMSHDLIAPRGRRPSPNPNPTPSALPRFIQHMISRGNRNEQGISAKAIRCLREHEVDKRRKDHKYRYKNGERALLEIEIYQQTTDLLIPRKPFARLVREMASEVGMMGVSFPPLDDTRHIPISETHLPFPFITSQNDIRFTQDALNAIQDAAEKYLTLMFEDAYGLAIYARRVTLKTEDIELLRRMKGPDGEPLLML